MAPYIEICCDYSGGAGVPAQKFGLFVTAGCRTDCLTIILNKPLPILPKKKKNNNKRCWDWDYNQSRAQPRNFWNVQWAGRSIPETNGLSGEPRVTHWPQRDLFDTLISGIHCRYSLLQSHSPHEDIRVVGKGELLSRESKSSSNIVRVDVWVVNEWRIRMTLRRKFSVPKISFPHSIQATHTHAFHSEVSIRLFGLWFPRRFVVASFDVGPMFPCNRNHEAMKNWHCDCCKPMNKQSRLSRCLQNVTQCQTRFMEHGCFMNPFLPFFWRISSIHSLPEGGSWEQQ